MPFLVEFFMPREGGPLVGAFEAGASHTLLILQ